MLSLDLSRYPEVKSIAADETKCVSRRSLFRKLTLATALSTLVTGTSFLPLANAQEPTSSTTCVPKPDGTTTCASDDIAAMSAEQVAEWLHGVPTFSLVDSEGVPYMVVGEDAQVTGYFFTSYEEAKRILQLARSSADKSIQEQTEQARREKRVLEDDSLINPWKEARISTIPLDVAVTLVTKSTKGNIFLLAPAASDIEQALELTGLEDLDEGKVPLFYLKDFTNSEGKSPLYFTKSQLLQDFNKTNKRQAAPPVLVTQLFAVLGQMVQGGNADVQNLVLVPPLHSLQHAKECIRVGGKQPPFVIGQRNLVL